MKLSWRMLPSARLHRKWIAMLGGAVIALGATSAMASTEQNNLASPPSGVQLGPDICNEQNLDNGVHVSICKTEHKSLLTPRVSMNAKIFNGTYNSSPRDVYVEFIQVADSHGPKDLCSMRGYLKTNKDLKCTATSLDPITAKVKATFAFRLKSGEMTVVDLTT
ncbi:hypothetical protein [Streptomyces sp. NPDC056661]|uniref:hypothetical protein n=1 Tax=Streptomyces sp. NPDC056661 TaxID=3345898 RepID=UPI0036A8396F